MSSFLYLRSQYNKLTIVERLFLVQRLRYWLISELNNLKKHKPIDYKLIEHFGINHMVWSEAWWIKLRDYSKSRLFPILIRNYL